MAQDRLSRPFASATLWTRRESAGLTRAMFADRCRQAGRSVSVQHVARLEKGESTPSEPLLVVLAKVLDCKVDDLFAPSAVTG